MRSTRAAAVLLGSLLVCAGALADVQVRVATFNIENFDAGEPPMYTPQFFAARDILRRVGADVVCVQEIDTTSDLAELADAAGYPFRILAHGTGTFDGAHHAGVMSVMPFNATAVETSVSLSGDPSARDMSRNFIVTQVAVPGAAGDLVVIGNHWKSGFEDADEFRRSIESIRAMQATNPFDSGTVPYLLVGDMNDDIGDSPDSPSTFTSLPDGMPAGFSLGSDIDFPVANGVFKPLQAGIGSQRLTVIPAFQLAGSPLDATRASSGRRLDYLWRSNAVTLVAAEVYDSRDEGLGGLPKFGDPLTAGTSATASDHLLVFADITIPDDQSGACCTGCGCDDTVNEAGCLALGGEFRGAGVVCGEEDPPCTPPSNDMIVNEVLITHDGTQDREFVEVVGAPHGLLCGLSLLVIEGEGLSKGRVDLAVAFDSCGGDPCALDADGYFVAGGSGLNPDLLIHPGTGIFEDGTQTIALVRDRLVSAGDDIDTDNDGVVDVPVGTVLDAVGIVNGDYPAEDKVYFGAPVIGPDGIDVATGGARCPDGIDTDASADWVRLSRDTAGDDGCVPATPGVVNRSACGGDGDGDRDRDLGDFALFQECFGLAVPECAALELDGQCGISLGDLEEFADRLSGPLQ